MKATELKQKLAAHEPVLLLDVREPEEVAGVQGVPGSVPMPMGKVFTEAAQGHLPKDEQIVAICKSGKRCEIVARELAKDGYTIDYLEGGISAWEA